MGDTTGKIGRALRLIASQGWADEDADVVSELLEQAHRLATLVTSGAGTSADARSVAEDLLDRLRSDTYGIS